MKNDFKRAEYLLELKGHKLEDGNRMHDMEFMEKILEREWQLRNQEILEYKDFQMKFSQLEACNHPHFARKDLQ